MSAVDVEDVQRRTLITIGVLLVVVGIVVVAWPAATALVIGVWLGVGLLLHGAREIAAATAGMVPGSRLWALAAGAASLLAGILLVLSPVVSVATVGVLIGVSWLVSGAVGLIAALVVPGHRILRIAVGALSVIAGLAVITQPAISVVALTWIAGAWTIITGLIVAFLAAVGDRGADVV